MTVPVPWPLLSLPLPWPPPIAQRSTALPRPPRQSQMNALLRRRLGAWAPRIVLIQPAPVRRKTLGPCSAFQRRSKKEAQPLLWFCHRSSIADQGRNAPAPRIELALLQASCRAAQGLGGLFNSRLYKGSARQAGEASRRRWPG